MIVDKDTNYVYINEDEPAETKPLGTRSDGTITKIDKNLDSLIYSNLFFEDNPTKQERPYYPIRIILAKNGDYIITGIVQDIFAESKKNGFLMRYSPDMKMKWYRIFKNTYQPGDLEYDNPDGKIIKESYLYRVAERNDGSFVLAGNNAYSKFDKGAVQIYMDLWLLTVDENGCFNGNCDEAIISKTKNVTNKVFVGTVYPNPTSSYVRIDDAIYDTYKIYDINGILQKQGNYSRQIDLQELPSGVYFLHIEKDGVDYLPYKILKI